MSTAWIYGVVGVHPWQLALFPDQAQQDVWGKDNGVRIASTYMPTGKAEPVEGGFRFNGRWSFSTGSKHCDWLFLGGLLPKRDGTPGLEHVTFLVPKADYRIEDNWDVLGLRGTGSHDIVVENAFVPAHRIQYTNDHSDVGCPGRKNTSWLFRIPLPMCSSVRCPPPAWARWKAPSRRSPSARRRTLESMATGWPRT
jgi:3-hydroxy-9,10-secoandrosta-1,3,5(10)-triene-9,17-dione monooxygenase